MALQSVMIPSQPLLSGSRHSSVGRLTGNFSLLTHPGSLRHNYDLSVGLMRAFHSNFCFHRCCELWERFTVCYVVLPRVSVAFPWSHKLEATLRLFPVFWVHIWIQILLLFIDPWNSHSEQLLVKRNPVMFHVSLLGTLKFLTYKTKFLQKAQVFFFFRVRYLVAVLTGKGK